jgi:iron complex transport system substrate-binding protein
MDLGRWCAGGPRTATLALAAACVLAAPAGAGPAAPERVVSLDPCADHYVLALADRDQIAALAPRPPGSRLPRFAERAEGLPRLRPTAEKLLMRGPDLAIRLWGGTRGIGDMLGRAGIEVLKLRYATGFDTARANLRRAGKALGSPARARRLIARMDRRLARLRARRLPEGERPNAVYVTPSGKTAGAGTFADSVLTAAGLANMGAADGRTGWYPLDLERLAMKRPDVVVAAQFETALRPDFWAVTRHSFVRGLFAQVPVIRVRGRTMFCQAWYAVDAVAQIQARMAELPGMLRPPQTAKTPAD